MEETRERSIILALTISLDGFIEGPNGEIDWISMDEQTGDFLMDFSKEIDTVIYGRKSYELYGNYMPGEESNEQLRQFYQSVNQMEKYVCSNTMQPEDGVYVLSGDISTKIGEIKRKAGKKIWLFGGADLITTFVNHDLIDEYSIAVQPVIIGSGKPLFQDITRRLSLQLTSSQMVATSGVVELRYQRKR